MKSSKCDKDDGWKKEGLSLDEHIQLALGHLTKGLDWRPIAKGTAVEGLPFSHSYMGKRLVMMHGYPELMEQPGRYLAALMVCSDAVPEFKDNITAEQASAHLARFLARKITPQGKFVTTEEELATINNPDEIFVEPVKHVIDKTQWYGNAGVEYNGHLSIPLEGLVRWFIRTDDKETRKSIERAVKGKISDPHSPEIRAGKGMVLPGLMTPLVLYYQHTGHSLARRYLNEVGNYLLSNIYPSYFPDGRHSHGAGVGHLHCRMGGIAGLARWGQLIGNADYVNAAEELLAVNTVWGTEFGFMPERHVYVQQGAGSNAGNIYQPWVTPDNKRLSFAHFTRPRCGWDTCEICVTADAIDAAIILAQSGYERYWDIAERYLNQVNRVQISDTSFLEGRMGTGKELIGASFVQVKESLQGGFFSLSSPTWAVPRRQLARMRPDGREGLCEGEYYGISCACCHGWGARTLGLVWQNIVTENGRTVEVNFPFNRKTAKVEVKSALPHDGRITVRALQTVKVFVRISDWVEHARVEVRVNGQRRRDVKYKNPFSDFVDIGEIRCGEKVEVRYPLRRQSIRYHIEYHPSIYEADWLGNTVMGIKEIPMLQGQGEELFDGLGNLYPA